MADQARGETDLASMLATLEVNRRPGVFAYVEIHDATGIDVGHGIEAILDDGESITVVASASVVEQRGWVAEFDAAWLTLAVHSALEAVGLTAAFSKALGDAGIPCNVIAGFRHDHILVPIDRVDDAIAALARLRAESS